MIVYDRGAYVINDGVYVNDERQKFETLESVFPSYSQSIGNEL